MTDIYALLHQKMKRLSCNLYIPHKRDPIDIRNREFHQGLRIFAHSDPAAFFLYDGSLFFDIDHCHASDASILT